MTRSTRVSCSASRPAHPARASASSWLTKSTTLKKRPRARKRRYDGLYVLRTNTKLSVFEVAMRYRELWKVERIFRTTKSGFDTRPVYHQSDEAIRGHLFCSFLALVLRAELETRLEVAGAKLEWRDIITDLDRLIETTVEQDGRHFILRNQAPGCAGTVF